MSLFTGLVRYARPGRGAPSTRVVCELCAAPIGEAHAHLVDRAKRRLLCTCRPCAILFPGQQGTEGDRRYRAVPDRVLFDPELVLDAAAYEALEIPVQLAFFGRFGGDRWVAIYPSPAGATESELSLEAFPALMTKSPLFAAVEPDVEALLVRARRGDDRFEAYLVPIDLAYELVGQLRSGARSLSGAGTDAIVDAFFERVRARSRPLRRPREARS